ncbi:hypothetical protein ACJ73_04534 [Blastomyces percursus]|uniref:Uncharacterized protein n=1 Tax=Blastomyces percursus TaxID=1658174 RepID=A0A1J9R8Y4_9EURO|nr:hypothetical protein ACJ73_04534 [Blastomyces percursus]
MANTGLSHNYFYKVLQAVTWRMSLSRYLLLEELGLGGSSSSTSMAEGVIGLANGRVVQHSLLHAVQELYPQFDPVLPALQKYSLSKWISAENCIPIQGRLPSSTCSVISYLLHVAMLPDHSIKYITSHFAMFGGSPSSIQGFKMMLTATWVGSPGISENKFAEAIAADSCVADERAVEEN